MSFGFSATDFVKAIELVVQLGDALRATGEARARFHDLIGELYALEKALLQVKRLELNDGLEIEQRALYSAASQCQLSIDRFWKKTSKLQPHMQLPGTGSLLKDTWAKIKWTLCKKEDVEQFRATIRGHTGSINILLSTVQLRASTKHFAALDLQGKRQDEHSKGITGMIQQISRRVMGRLDEVSKKIAETVQQGKALLETSAKVVDTNVRVYAMVKDIYVFVRRMPAQINRQQPIVFTDAFNRIRPFHLEFVRSERALLSIVEHDFKEMGCDLTLLRQRRYVIDDLGTGAKLDESLPWDVRLKPGQRVGMSMVFKRKTNDASTCPQCHMEQGKAEDQEMTW